MEFIIKTNNGDWFNFPEDCGPEVFLPFGIEANVKADSETASVKCGDAVFSFSMEEPGIQIVLESGEASETEVNDFVKAVMVTISNITKQECNYIQYA